MLSSKLRRCSTHSTLSINDISIDSDISIHFGTFSDIVHPRTIVEFSENLCRNRVRHQSNRRSNCLVFIKTTELDQKRLKLFWTVREVEFLLYDKIIWQLFRRQVKNCNLGANTQLRDKVNVIRQGVVIDILFKLHRRTQAEKPDRS